MYEMWKENKTHKNVHHFIIETKEKQMYSKWVINFNVVLK